MPESRVRYRFQDEYPSFASALVRAPVRTMTPSIELAVGARDPEAREICRCNGNGMPRILRNRHGARARTRGGINERTDRWSSQGFPREGSNNYRRRTLARALRLSSRRLLGVDIRVDCYFDSRRFRVLRIMTAVMRSGISRGTCDIYIKKKILGTSSPGTVLYEEA